MSDPLLLAWRTLRAWLLAPDGGDVSPDSVLAEQIAVLDAALPEDATVTRAQGREQGWLLVQRGGKQ